MSVDLDKLYKDMEKQEDEAIIRGIDAIPIPIPVIDPSTKRRY